MQSVRVVAARRRGRVATVAVATAAVALLAQAQATAAPAHRSSTSTTAATAVAPSFTWPQFQHDPTLSGRAADPAFTTSNAASLGVSRMTFLGAPSLASPTVWYSSALGATLVFTGNEAGVVTAWNEASGQPVWSDSFGSGIRSTPSVDGTSLWVAPSGAHRVYELDAATGTVTCSAPVPLNVDSSPTFATPPGGKRTAYIGVNDAGTTTGPLVAIDEATCAVDFSATPEPEVGTGGVWDGISYTQSPSGEGIVLFGTADPDSSLYAIDAVTGASLWRLHTQDVGGMDVGAGVTVSPPGVNGFADGVAYGVNKAGWLYAIDPVTGTVYWSGQYTDVISTPALDGSTLVLAGSKAISAVDATTGALRWTTSSPAQFDGSPTVVGLAGSEIIVDSDLAGRINVFSLATGAALYHYQTGTYVAASAADTDGHLLVTSGDGYLYDLTVGGGNGSRPSTAVTSPSQGSSVANPRGSLPIAGTATAAAGHTLAGVTVAVQQGDGRWWDGASATWVAGPYPNPATLASPGAASSTWRMTMPVSAAGGLFTVQASAVDDDAIADVAAAQPATTAARSQFGVKGAPGAPTVTVPSRFVAPTTSTTVRGSGFAAGETVQFAIAGTPVGSAVAGSTGVVPATTIKVPQGLPFGSSTLTGTGATSGKTGSIILYVTNTWSQAGGGALKPGYEPNDLVFAHHLSVSGSDFLRPAWSYGTAAAPSGSTSVVDGVAYAADASGSLTAIDIASGMAKWTATPASPGAAAAGAPAVDPVRGVVVDATTGGALAAVSQATGVAAWSDTLTASGLTPPSLANGTVVVGSAAGDLWAVDDRTGTVTWHATVPGSVAASPTIDTAAGSVVVGDSSGQVTALALADGSVRWATALTGAVTTTAVASNGTVVVGTSSGEVARLAESTGATGWTATLPAGVTAGPALQAGAYLVGTGDGAVWSLAGGSGAASQVATGTSAVVAVVTTQALILVELANGTVSALKPGGGGWQTSVGASSGGATPTVVNGEVFLGGAAGVTCYVVPGQLPA